MGKAERPGSRAEQGRGGGEEAAEEGPGPLESCYCLRSLLREAPSKELVRRGPGWRQAALREPVNRVRNDLNQHP